MLFRNKVIFAKTEVTYGTDPTPIGTDAVLTSNLQIQPYVGPTVSRNLDRSTLGGQSVVNTNPYSVITFDVELSGSGTPATAVAWDAVIKGCGFAQGTTSPTATGKQYTPISSTWPSLTFYFFHDGQRHVITGARGTMTMSFSRGAIPVMSYTFTGRYATPTNVAASGIDVTDYKSAIAVTYANTPTFTMGGSPLHVMRSEAFTIDVGNQVIPRNIINANEIFITDRAMAGSVTVEAATTKNWFSGGIESHTALVTNVLRMIHGTVSGNKIKIDAPAVQITSVAQTDSEGVLVYQLGLSFTPVSGNDEIVITTF